MTWNKLEFLNFPQNLHKPRTDSCTALKGNNDQSISFKPLRQIPPKCKIFIRLQLKTHQELRHFVKLVNLDKKNKSIQENEDGKICCEVETLKNNELGFLGIKTETKDHARKYIERLGINEVDNVLKENLACSILQIILVDVGGNLISALKHELRFGNSDDISNCDEIEIVSYTPKVLCNEGSVTFCLKTKFKNEGDMIRLIIEDEENNFKKEITKSFQHAKNVYEFKINLREIKSDYLSARLSFCINEYVKYSKPLSFTIHKNPTDLLKRKPALSEYKRDQKMIKLTSEPALESQKDKMSKKEIVKQKLLQKRMQGNSFVKASPRQGFEDIITKPEFGNNGFQSISESTSSERLQSNSFFKASPRQDIIVKPEFGNNGFQFISEFSSSKGLQSNSFFKASQRQGLEDIIAKPEFGNNGFQFISEFSSSKGLQSNSFVKASPRQGLDDIITKSEFGNNIFQPISESSSSEQLQSNSFEEAHSEEGLADIISDSEMAKICDDESFTSLLSILQIDFNQNDMDQEVT